MEVDGEINVINNFINGEFQESKEYLDSYDPSTGKKYLRIPNSDETDVNQAVIAAKTAFKKWSQTPGGQRSAILNRAADLLESSLEVFARAESRDQGKPISLALNVEIPRAVHNLRFFAGASQYQMDKSNYMDGADAVNITTRQPIGVCCLISPWNLPLYLLTFKLAPALVYGNTVVCKPSEMTSVTAYMLCHIFVKAGLPAGVLNMVFGTGPKAGYSLVRHPDVPVISFTGSTLTGKKIRQATVDSCKKLSLELGGKNASIVFDDVGDIDNCVRNTVRSCFTNQGEICLCTSRVFVHKNIYNEFLNKLVIGARSMKVGDPQDKSTEMGALISKEHLEKVRGYVDIARNEGATIMCGEGVEPLDLSADLCSGYFMRPTIITNISRKSRCMKEEIFGPVICVVPFDTEEEVIEEANNVEYGLCAVIWSRDISRIHRVARQLHVGTVWTNSWLLRDLRVPFGGMKESGVGREGMEESAEFYTEAKTICIKL